MARLHFRPEKSLDRVAGLGLDFAINVLEKITIGKNLASHEFRLRSWPAKGAAAVLRGNQFSTTGSPASHSNRFADDFSLAISSPW